MKFVVPCPYFLFLVSCFLLLVSSLPKPASAQSLFQLRAQWDANLSRLHVEAPAAYNAMTSSLNGQIQNLEREQQNRAGTKAGLQTQEVGLRQDLLTAKAQLADEQSLSSDYQSGLACSSESECQQRAALQNQLWQTISGICRLSREDFAQRTKWLLAYGDATAEYRPLIEDLNRTFDLFSWQIPPEFRIFRSQAGSAGDAVQLQTTTLYVTNRITEPTLVWAFFNELQYHAFGIPSALPTITLPDGELSPPDPVLSLCFSQGAFPHTDPALAGFILSCV